MPRIAILGASGFIGSQIVDAFESKGWEVVIFCRSKTGTKARQEILSNLFCKETLSKALSISKPDIVLSTAWETEHGKFWTNLSNIKYRDATLKFAELSFQSGSETFIGLGTMSEYGFSPGDCNADHTPLIPSDIYSQSKIETGIELKEIGNTYGQRTHWARVFQAFGPNEKSERFIPGLISTLSKGDKFSIRNPSFVMDWIHTIDIASAFVFMVENQLDHFVDIGTGEGTSVREVSELVCEELDLNPKLLDYVEQISGNEKRVVVHKSSELLSLGWKPSESLRNRISSLR